MNTTKELAMGELTKFVVRESLVRLKCLLYREHAILVRSCRKATETEQLRTPTHHTKDEAGAPHWLGGPANCWREDGCWDQRKRQVGDMTLSSLEGAAVLVAV